jgi:hypothetical protein
MTPVWNIPMSRCSFTKIGGKLAQLGGRLIDSIAKNLASEFFASFGGVVGSAAVA